MFRLFYLYLFSVVLLVSCKSSPKPLPILGRATINGNDTVYPRIADFTFTDQDSNYVANSTFTNKVYITDFIFLSCIDKSRRSFFSDFLQLSDTLMLLCGIRT